VKYSFRFPTYLLSLVLVLFLFSCKSAGPKKNAAPDMATLKAFMTGSFNSAEQAAQDSAYYNISLHMYPIWEGKGNWLYVEQALAVMQERPYRQRVYELEKTGEGAFISKVYELPDAKAAIGKWKTPKWFDEMTPDDLTEKEGCGVNLAWENGIFKGATGEKTCQSSLRGASYATSKVTVYPEKIISWDQGWDDKGEQVWGAEKGGYVFIKLKK